MAVIGYARVSTDGQTLQAQTEALHLAGCARIFAEKISGAYSDRPQLAKALAALGEGDTLVVCKLRDQPGTSSTPSMQSAKLAQASDR
jgi:DNA invertase Pin-like site-specific DNA recombinase